MSKVRMSVLNVEEQVDVALQEYEQDVPIEELVRNAYLQGMVDKEIESMEQLDGGEYVCDLMSDVDGDDSVFDVSIITWEEWTGGDCTKYGN